MKPALTRHTFLALACLAAALLTTGCEDAAPERAAPPAEAPPPEAKKVLLAPNIFLEVQGQRRRVIVSAQVCLTRGPLELLLCRKNTKEHEAILSADVDARKVHLALNAAGAVEGSTVRFQPTYRPARGTTIKVFLQYQHKGKLVTVPAQNWIRNVRDGKPLDSDWVFGGSILIDDPLDRDKPKIYLANDGDLICVSNFETAMLDLPIKSTKDDAERAYEVFTENIPPMDTRVAVILEPVPPPRKTP